eukprot:TRINITY_DN514_c0_g2_i1.p1 TRINITY_DN514_c0_g2~~TRINITY_DN514_c0_g2_i1.p1  ORF type:complete len:1349 (+),score=474.84 TRINITY_DN514_c0_g2_i1:122-4168(+)
MPPGLSSPTAGATPALISDGALAADSKVGAVQWGSTLTMCLNGQAVLLQNPDPETTLLEFLRQKGLTGTKLGCGEGGCGACVVAVTTKTPEGEVTRSVNACLAPLVSLDGAAVTTVEGLGSTVSGMHPVQRRMAQSHATQCGFCTPGFVVSIYAALKQGGRPSMQQLEHALDGNLCRCTGYRPIVDAMRPFATDGGAQPDPYDPSTEPKLPPALAQHQAGPLAFRGPRQEWYRPTSMDQLLALRQRYPHGRLACGNTELAIETKFKRTDMPVVIAPTHVPELLRITDTGGRDGLEVGGSVTYTRIQAALEEAVRGEPEHGSRFWRAMLRMLKLWASTPIRNVATIAGNLCTASPIGDVAQLLVAAGSTVTLRSAARGARRVSMRDFFTGYRQTCLAPDEILQSVTLPRMRQFEFFQGYKTSRRKEDDIAIVNAGLRVLLSPDAPHRVLEAGFAFGGMGPTTKSAPQAEQAVIGKEWATDLCAPLTAALAQDLPMRPGAPGGQTEYRSTLAASFMFKFVLQVCEGLREGVPSAASAAEEAESAAEWGFIGSARPAAHGVQHFDAEGLMRQADKVHTGPKEQPAAAGSVHQAVRHMAADIQCTGEALYCDDVPAPRGTAAGQLVLSTQPHARILSVDASACSAIPGFIAFIDRNCVRGSNAFGPVVKDEVVFAEDEVFCAGQVIGLCVAETKRAADAAAQAVRVSYEPLPAITGVKEAVAQQSFYPGERRLERGDVDGALASCEKVLEGELLIGGQEHFYLETQATLATPGEAGEMDILTSSQAVAKTQACVASALGVSYNRVVCRTKRMGGGFGGKESRNIFLSCAVAVAAQRIRRPVRVMLDRDVDMSSTGTRHPFLGKWRAAVSGGRVQAMEVQLYSNAGWSHDLSYPVLERACAHLENAYFVPHLRVVGRLCRTNCVTNTAFRGFGGPQGMMVGEAIITQAAHHLGVLPEELREKSLYSEGQVTHYKQLIPDDNLRRCWAQATREAALAERRAAAARFNAEHRWRKRGVAAIPVKFGMSFNAKFMNQAGALVHLYQDGTVLVSHGGTEMGQGLHTKMAQVAATALGIPLDNVYIAETSTDRVANTAPTAASVSADMNGFAIQSACEELLARLRPVRERLGPDATLAQVAVAAHLERIDLTGHGFYVTPDIGYNFATQDGARMFHYFSNGTAVTEVEVDTLTGEWLCLGAHIVHDVGLSLSPAIDIGQIEGAFVQGMGCFTSEELMWGDPQGLPWVPQGLCFTRGPSTYKIPAVSDVPADFRVALLRDAPAKGVIHSSKGIGEPPLFLGSSVFWAIADAVHACRTERGLPPLQMNSPASVERIRMACGDDLSAAHAPAADWHPVGCW